MKKNLQKFSNLGAFVVVVAVNVLATLGILGGVSTKEVSYMYKSFLTPADYAFSIWSLIYILLAVLVIRQMKNKEVREKMWYWFIASCILNVGWIFAWQFKSIALSFVLIVLLLLDLLLLMREMKDSDLFSQLTIGLYTGWINVAMLANLGALFTRYNWTLLGMDSMVWAMIGLVFGIVWICFFIFAYSNIYYALGACWGYFGIALGSGNTGIIILSTIGMVSFAISTFFVIKRNNMLT